MVGATRPDRSATRKADIPLRRITCPPSTAAIWSVALTIRWWPAAAGSICRSLPQLIPRAVIPHGSDSAFNYFRCVYSGSTPSPSQLTPASFYADFSAVAHDQGLLNPSRTAWFDASLCLPTSRGLPSSTSVASKNRSIDPSFASHITAIIAGSHRMGIPNQKGLRKQFNRQSAADSRSDYAEKPLSRACR